MEKAISLEFLDIDHFRQQLSGRDSPATQIEPGRINIRFRYIDLGGMIFSDNHLNRKIIDHSRIEKGSLYFVINFAPATFCGIEVGYGNLSVLDSSRDYNNVLGGNWYAIGILVNSSVLSEEGIKLAPHLLEGPERASIALPVELIGSFRRLARAAFAEGRVDTLRLRSGLLRALGKALGLAHGPRTPRLQSAVEGYELTQRMIRYVESRFGQRITVNEVAGELNLTPRALHYATRSTLDISPLDLILAFRLNHVRNELWDQRRSDASITRAALMQDFGHLGRFSQQYRALFGEAPSETLQRIRALAA